MLSGGLPLPTFSDALVSVSVLAPTDGSGGSADWPRAGLAAASPNSEGFAALKGNSAASCCVPASFRVAGSEIASRPAFLAGPLAVERADVFAVRSDEHTSE